MMCQLRVQAPINYDWVWGPAYVQDRHLNGLLNNGIAAWGLENSAVIFIDVIRIEIENLEESLSNLIEHL